jgi:hypothetical protein
MKAILFALVVTGFGLHQLGASRHSTRDRRPATYLIQRIGIITRQVIAD